MARIALLEIGLFLAPFLAFALYLVLTRGRVGARDLLSGPVLWLGALGLVLTALGLALFMRPGENSSSAGIYVPPHYENGVLVPGRVEPRSAR